MGKILGGVSYNLAAKPQLTSNYRSHHLASTERFVQIFPLDVMEKSQRIFWPTHYLGESFLFFLKNQKLSRPGLHSLGTTDVVCWILCVARHDLCITGCLVVSLASPIRCLSDATRGCGNQMTADTDKRSWEKGGSPLPKSCWSWGKVKH